MAAQIDLEITKKNEEQSNMLANRIENAARNATAVPDEQYYDGWLLRFSEEPTKRTRSIYAVDLISGSQDLNARLSRCEQIYAQKGLPMAVRLTSLENHKALEHELAIRGYERGEETVVMVRKLDAPLSSIIATPNGSPCVTLERTAFSEILGRLKRSDENVIKAHSKRLAALEIDVLPRCIQRSDEPIAVGLAALEDDLVGVFDVAVASSHRRKGWGGLLVCQLMADAAGRGARYAYLQVDASNQTACRLWRRLGFQDLYTYWYRCEPSALTGRNPTSSKKAATIEQASED